MYNNNILAIIVPCYNEEAVLYQSNQVFSQILHQMINNELISDKSYICYVNDGSKDNTWQIIEELHGNDAHITGISFSKNFGHQAAMLAGLTTCEADIFITIDADMQEDPYAMIDMVKEYKKGFDIVYGVREKRKDKFLKKHLSNGFYKVMSMLGSNTISNASEYRLISKRIVNEIKKYSEKNIYLRGIIASIGFSFSKVYYNRSDRIAGESKYSWSKLLYTALNGITTTSTKPLNMILGIGIFTMGAAFINFILLIISIIYNSQYISSLLTIFVVVFIGAVQLLSLGIIGQYIEKILNDTKNRPAFIIDKTLTGS